MLAPSLPLAQVGFRLYLLVNHLFDYQEQEGGDRQGNALAGIDRSRVLAESELGYYQQYTARVELLNATALARILPAKSEHSLLEKMFLFKQKLFGKSFHVYHEHQSCEGKSKFIAPAWRCLVD